MYPGTILAVSGSFSGISMNVQAIKQSITPLRMIFWGGLLCIFDITVSETRNGEGFRFDILNDAVGTILITIGVFRLSAIYVHDRYAAIMKFVRVVSVLSVLEAIREHFVMPLHPAISFALLILSMVTLAAIVTFCIAMRWFCEEALLPQAAGSWSVTTILFLVIYVIPLGLFYIAGAIAIVTNTSFNINLGPAGLALLVVFAIPIFHLFISTSRMKREAEMI
jgi:hypothetical protein